MKKSDLVSGKHVVELENGDKYLYLDGYFVNTRFWYDIDAKICKIFEIQKPYSLTDMLIFDKGLNLIWERKPELSEAERTILKSLNREYKWICRDLEGFLYINGGSKPYQLQRGSWAGALDEFPFEHLFQMVQWEDKKPTLIADLLERDE